MPSLHERLVAKVAELRAVAEAATPTVRDVPWEVGDLRLDDSGLCVSEEDAALIVAAVNTLRRAIPTWEETLARHEPWTNDLINDRGTYCSHCQERDNSAEWPCDDFRSLARAVGVLEEE